MQNVDFVDPWNEPALQRVQALDPIAAENEPLGQSLHVACPSPEYLPWSHLLQELDPSEFWKSPGGHGGHDDRPLLGPYDPFRQSRQPA